jgi:hypothetical protein
MKISFQGTAQRDIFLLMSQYVKFFDKFIRTS